MPIVKSDLNVFNIFIYEYFYISNFLAGKKVTETRLESEPVIPPICLKKNRIIPLPISSSLYVQLPKLVISFKQICLCSMPKLGEVVEGVRTSLTSVNAS